MDYQNNYGGRLTDLINSMRFGQLPSMARMLTLQCELTGGNIRKEMMHGTKEN